ncbi:MAG: ABC transporter permease [Lachnospiraceae bacterium]|nr:ABC transporter permease [Lachnospiraceae bacterium]
MKEDTKKSFTGEPDAPEERGLWMDVWTRLCKNKVALVGMFFLVLLVVVSLSTFIIDIVTKESFYNNYVIKQELTQKLKGPGAGHIFGQDEFGRDVFLRIIWGTRYSLLLGVGATIMAAILGGAVGAVAGFYGKHLDNLLMRLMDILLSIPSILLSIAIVAALGTSMFNVMLAIAISYIPQYARIVRAAIMEQKSMEYIEASRAVGAADPRIIIRHIIPNALAPIIVQATLGIAGCILSIAGLSFLGLGIQPPVPEWGGMLSNARQYMRDAWHITAFPGLAIMLTILSLNLVGDALRDALDPKLKN